MALPVAGSKPPIAHGWIGAVLLLILYVGSSVAAGYVLPDFESWITFSFISAILLVYLFRVFIDKKSFWSIGLQSAALPRQAGIGICLGTLLVSIGTLIIYFLKGISWIDIAPNWRAVLVNAVLMLMVAFAEELVFRGYILRNLMRSMNRWIALLVSAVFFTIVHAANPDVPALAMINTLAGGLLMGLTFMHTRKLWTPVGFHFIWNFLQGPVLGFRVSGIEFESIMFMESRGSNIVSGGVYGFEGSAVATVLLFLTIAIWTLLDKQKAASMHDYLSR